MTFPLWGLNLGISARMIRFRGLPSSDWKKKENSPRLVHADLRYLARGLNRPKCKSTCDRERERERGLDWTERREAGMTSSRGEDLNGAVAAMKGEEEKSQWKLFIEDISVLQLVMSFLFMGVLCLLLMLYLMFTPLWPLPTLYFAWQFYDWHKPERGGRRSDVVRNWKVWQHFKDYFPVKLVKTAELSPSKNYILGCHPHGIMSMGAFSSFATEAGGFAEAFPGMRSTLAVLAGLFRLPIFRDYLMIAGLLPVSKESLEYKLSRTGAGNAVVIIIGGAEESLACTPGVNTVVMKHRKGFVRLALENGADLVPVYSFGENELFPQVVLSEGSVGRKLQALFKQVMGFAPCIFTGGRWLLLPYRSPVTTVVGGPISVPYVCNPSEEQVDHYHTLYMEALSKLFHTHKTSCGLSETHQLCII